MHRGNRMTSSDQFAIARAWFVHAWTTSGLIFAFLALIAIAEDNAARAVAMLAVTVFIDGVDGPMARAWNVKRWASTFDGRRADDIIDYITYTFIPVYFAWQFEIITEPWVWVLPLVLMVSLFGFSNDGAKTDDGFFTGFPSYWNGAVIYLFWLGLPVWVNASLLLLLCLMTFVPIKYVSFNQTVQLRPLQRVLLVIWVIVLAIMMSQSFYNPNPALLYLSLFYPFFYFGSSLYLSWITREQN